LSGTRVKYTIYFATLAPRTSVYGYGPNEPHSILMLAQLLRRGSRWNALLLVLHFYTFVASYVKSSLSEKRRVCMYVCMCVCPPSRTGCVLFFKKDDTMQQ